MHEVEEACMCLICNEIYDEEAHFPRILRCGHTLCTHCIQRMIVGDRLICPLCKCNVEVADGVESITKNFAAMDLIQASKDALCREDHGNAQPECEIHQEKLKYYDQTCNQLICPDCLVFTHKDHSFCLIQQQIENAKKEVHQLLDKAFAKITDVTTAISSFDSLISEQEKTCDGEVAKLHFAFDQIRSALISREAALEHQLKDAFQQQISFLAAGRQFNIDSDARMVQKRDHARLVVERTELETGNIEAYLEQLKHSKELLEFSFIQVRNPADELRRISIEKNLDAIWPVIKKVVYVQHSSLLQWDKTSLKSAKLITPSKVGFSFGGGLAVSLPIPNQLCTTFSMKVHGASKLTGPIYIAVVPQGVSDLIFLENGTVSNALLCWKGCTSEEGMISGILNFPSHRCFLNGESALLNEKVCVLVKCEGPRRPVLALDDIVSEQLQILRPFDHSGKPRFVEFL